MAGEQDKVVAAQAAPTAKRSPREKGVSSEERRLQDALEDDEVLESLKELHARKGKVD